MKNCRSLILPEKSYSHLKKQKIEKKKKKLPSMRLEPLTCKSWAQHSDHYTREFSYRQSDSNKI